MWQLESKSDLHCKDIGNGFTFVLKSLLPVGLYESPGSERKDWQDSQTNLRLGNSPERIIHFKI